MVYCAGLEPPLSVSVQPSRQLLKLMVLSHSLAIVASLVNSLSVWLKVGLSLGIALHAVFVINKIRAGQTLIQFTQAGGWMVNGAAVQVLGSTVLTRLAIFLHCSAVDRHHQLIIFNDALPPDDYRQLLVRLKTTYQAPD